MVELVFSIYITSGSTLYTQTCLYKPEPEPEPKPEPEPDPNGLAGVYIYICRSVQGY